MPQRENPEMLWLSLALDQPVRGFFDFSEVVAKIKPALRNDGSNLLVRTTKGKQFLESKELLLTLYWGDEFARFERTLTDGELAILNSDLFQARTRTVTVEEIMPNNPPVNTDSINSYNDLVYAVAKRARELGDLKMPELRSEAGYNCDTFAEAQRVNAHMGRGELIELVLTEEFVEEFDRDFSSE